MTFLINGYIHNLCNPFQNAHVWIWAGDTTNFDIPPDWVCSCGAIRYKNREHPERELEDTLFKELEEASIYDFGKFENEE